MSAIPTVESISKKARATYKAQPGLTPLPTNLLKKDPKPRKEKLPKDKKEREAVKVDTFKRMGQALLTKQANHDYLETHDLSKDIAELNVNVQMLKLDIKTLYDSQLLHPTNKTG